MTPKKLTQLDWFPINVRDYLQRAALLTLAEEGALNRAIVTSWDAALRGAPAGTLPDSEPVFERLFGATWRDVVFAVKQHFHPDPERPGQLRCDWLAELYERQSQRHARSVQKGKDAQERRRNAMAERRRARDKAKRDKALSSTPVEVQSNCSSTDSSTQAETSFEKEIPFGGSPSEIPLKGETPDGAAAGRGVATAAPPASNPGVPISDGRRVQAERPDRRRSNAPTDVGHPPVAEAERWERSAAEHVAAVDAEYRRLLGDVPTPDDEITRRLLRRSALLTCYASAAGAGAVA